MFLKENNKRIAKNTILLYIRMFAVMGVTLFTSRVVLDVLGSEDYGINNVVGGIVMMLSFLSNTMTHSAQRFFSIELGREDYERLKKIFQVNLTIYLSIGFLVILIGETVGIWFMHNYLIIPKERMLAADWVMHFAVLTFCMSLFVLPYKAAIMARENMSIMAYLSIIEVVAKLGLVYLLFIISVDKLILFSALNFIVTIVINSFYLIEARRKYVECCGGLAYDRTILRSVLSFTSWTVLGHFAMVIRSQGMNILLNMFCGPVVNAARAIAFQVNTAVSQFYTNFFMAVKPQIIKYYSVDDKENMYRLVVRSSKLCYFLVFLLSLPILLKTDYILSLWLVEVPEYTSMFVKLVLLNTLVEAIMPGLSTSIDATGKIKTYEIIVTILLLANIPIGWWFLQSGYNPYVPFYTIIILSFGRLILQFFILRALLGFCVKKMCVDILCPIFLTTLLAIILPVCFTDFLNNSFFSFANSTLIALVSSIIVFFYLGLNKEERLFVQNIIRKKSRK